ncbi:Dicer-like protein 2 [Elasticomyces elasticus]|nr:Dicer-like protein 2 [Elasticomyces elasticus]
MIILTPMELPVVNDFILYYDGSLRFKAKVEPVRDRTFTGESPLIETACSITRTLLSSIYGSRMQEIRSDFLVLFIPVTSRLSEWATYIQGRRLVTGVLQKPVRKEHLGLVRLIHQPFGAYVYHGHDDPIQINVVPFPKRRNFLHEPTASNDDDDVEAKVLSVPAADCKFDNLPSLHAIFAAFVPSILHQIGTALTVDQLCRQVLLPIGDIDRDLVRTAITTPMAMDNSNYERVEFLGDCVLKFCTHVQLVAQHPTWPEAYLTAEKGRTNRNEYLAAASLAAGLNRFMIRKGFTGQKWRPTYVEDALRSKDEKNIRWSTKMLADVVEALIGASYLDGGSEKAIDCMRIILCKETWHSLDVCHDMLLQDVPETAIPGLETLEQLLCHTFAKPTLLLEAITHASSPSTFSGLSYERLEFLGDGVLDIIVTREVYSHKSTLPHYKMHSAREVVVNAHFLGFCCMEYSIAQERIDLIQQCSADPLEVTFVPKQSHQTFSLHHFLRANRALTTMKAAAVERYNTLRPIILDALENDITYPWSALVALAPEKFLCDLVESLLGALYVDTRGSFSACEIFLEKLGVLPYLRKVLEKGIVCLHPKERLGVLADSDRVKYDTNPDKREGEGPRTYSCAVLVGEHQVGLAEGCRSKEEAEVNAALGAIAILEGQGRAFRKRKKRAGRTEIDPRGGGTEAVDPEGTSSGEEVAVDGADTDEGSAKFDAMDIDQ